MPTLQHSFPDFGQWLTYSEGIRSNTARRRGIANIPTATQYTAMLAVYTNIYLPLCLKFGKLPVSSFFRIRKLNTAVGGSKTSQHMTGEAIDIDCDSLVGEPSNRQLYEYILKHLEFDQLGLEYPDEKGNPGWVHVSFVATRPNRKNLFIAT